MIYNPIDTKYKSIVGAVPSNKMIKFRVKGCFDSVIFVIQKEGEDVCKYKMTKNEEFFEVQLSFSVGLYFYYFEISSDEFISLSSEHLGEISRIINAFQLSVYDKNYIVPSILSGGLIYQIFPDRFYSSKKDIGDVDGRVIHKDKSELPIFEPNADGEVLNNDFFGGDLKGIIEKIDYLKSLNVTAIYLNPIFEAYSNHRYDTADYLKIDSLLGSEQDLINLIKIADKNGIKIILDGVFNHTGSNSVYFNKCGKYQSYGAYQGKNSPYFDWYDFTDYPEYNSWWGIKTLPAVNKAESSPFIDFICGKNGVLEHYTTLGVAGWRLDVVDELPSHFVKRIRNAVKNINEDAIIIGEVWEDASNKISYGKRREYFLGKELDSVMNYPLKDAIINFVKTKDSSMLTGTIKNLIDHYPKNVLNSLMNILSTHDTYRLISALLNVDVSGLSKSEMARLNITKEQFEEATFSLKIATLLQFTLPGVPTIYYGDEIGMHGFSDPLNRMFFDWDNVNTEILDWYKKLSSIRKEFSLFFNCEYKQIYSSKNVLIYKISDDKEEILVGINLSKYDVDLLFDGILKDLLFESEYENSYKLLAKSFVVLANMA